MTTLIAIPGSLRRESINAGLLRAAAEVSPDGVRVEPASLQGIPLYDGDQEAEHGIPASVQKLKDRIAASDGLLIATPEYNNGIPGVLKNAIDWLSRPPQDIARVFRDRPVALLGATPGRGGTALAHAAWLPVIRVLGMRPWFGGSLQIAQARQSFNGDGTLNDAETRKRLAAFLQGFLEFVRENRK